MTVEVAENDRFAHGCATLAAVIVIAVPILGCMGGVLFLMQLAGCW